MLIIGLTGGIGCGKSLIAKFFQEAGIPIISADQIAKEIMNSDPEVKAKLINVFGTQIYTPDGELDRKKVAEIIFSNQQDREQINAIVHPYVIKRQLDELKRIEQSGDTDIAGVEAALIYEAHAEHQFDYIVVISAPRELVIQRLQKRDGLTRTEIMKRILSQMPLEEKIKQADYVIYNDGSIRDLRHRVNELIICLRRNLIKTKEKC